MLDLSHIPNSQQDVQIFYSNGVPNGWQTWRKPRKCNYIWIMCIGGAGGGGGGGAPASPYSTGGGSGGISRALYNAQQLPDTLYVQVGIGGAGGNTGVAGSAGTRSWVALQPSVLAQNVITGGSTGAAAGGTAGTGGSAIGETILGQSVATFLTLSNFLAVAGVTAVGNTGLLVGPNLTPLSSQLVTAGASGPNFNTVQNLAFDGASILSSSISPLIPGGLAGLVSGSNGGNGADGITSWKPFFSTGGAGGGSAVSGSGGNGGNGGIGSGGGAGGGGNSTLGYTSGRGGKGGDGLVVIISF